MFARCNSIPRAISNVRDVLNWLEMGDERPFAEWESQSMKIAESWALVVHFREALTNDKSSNLSEGPTQLIERCNNVICELNTLFAFTTSIDERNTERQARSALTALSKMDMNLPLPSAGFR
jgi:hypothetical protein